MKIRLQRRLRAGYTLVELTVAMVVGMAVASLCLMMVSQYTTFQQMMQRQNFLLEEAPVINNLLSRIIGRAEAIRLYTSTDAALSGSGGAVETGATALALSFSNTEDPDGDRSFGVIAFEDGESGRLLRFYPLNAGGGVNSAEGAAWTISRSVKSANFSMEEGILRVTLVGPNDESITYSGTEQL